MFKPQLERIIVTLRTNCTLRTNHCKSLRIYLIFLTCSSFSLNEEPSSYKNENNLAMIWLYCQDLLSTAWSVHIAIELTAKRINIVSPSNWNNLKNDHDHNPIRYGNVTFSVRCQLLMLNIPKRRPARAQILKKSSWSPGFGSSYQEQFFQENLLV